ncbi:hypothetical protein K7X08_004455 [Anisodus acutangulus]|uniref:Uncharacterized protein n=1 Tax=Anisodus acutangulus TaxID=402998 RepID=A0A9Q1MF53_9SOLA|nr:hypothetical protein K7X08_004455 [Anisodus acutangulus]
MWRCPGGPGSRWSRGPGFSGPWSRVSGGLRWSSGPGGPWSRWSQGLVVQVVQGLWSVVQWSVVQGPRGLVVSWSQAVRGGLWSVVRGPGLVVSGVRGLVQRSVVSGVFVVSGSVVQWSQVSWSVGVQVCGPWSRWSVVQGPWSGGPWSRGPCGLSVRGLWSVVQVRGQGPCQVWVRVVQGPGPGGPWFRAQGLGPVVCGSVFRSGWSVVQVQVCGLRVVCGSGLRSRGSGFRFVVQWSRGLWVQWFSGSGSSGSVVVRGSWFSGSGSGFRVQGSVVCGLVSVVRGPGV